MELRTEFKRSLQTFLKVCAEKGIEPRRHFSGKFNLRISPDLHEKLVIAACASEQGAPLLHKDPEFKPLPVTQEQLPMKALLSSCRSKRS